MLEHIEGMSQKTREQYRKQWVKQQKLDNEQIDQLFKSDDAFYRFINNGRQKSDYTSYEEEYQKFLSMTNGKNPAALVLYR